MGLINVSWTTNLRERWASFLTEDDLVGVLVDAVMPIIGLIVLRVAGHSSINIMQVEGSVHHNSPAGIRGREDSFHGGISLNHRKEEATAMHRFCGQKETCSVQLSKETIRLRTMAEQLEIIPTRVEPSHTCPSCHKCLHMGLYDLSNYPQTTDYGILRSMTKPIVGSRINLWSFYCIGTTTVVCLAFWLKIGFGGLWYGLLFAQATSVVSILFVVLVRTGWEAAALHAKKLTSLKMATFVLLRYPNEVIRSLIMTPFVMADLGCFCNGNTIHIVDYTFRLDLELNLEDKVLADGDGNVMNLEAITLVSPRQGIG